MKKDIAIIGGGPAGMAAAVKLHELGIDDVVIFEKEERLGGILLQCIHDGFGVTQFGCNYAGTEYAALYLRKIRDYGMEYRTSTTITGIHPFSAGIGVASAAIRPQTEKTEGEPELQAKAQAEISETAGQQTAAYREKPERLLRVEGCDREGAFICDAKAVIVATGCRERGRGMIGIGGTRPAGIYTAGTAQAMLNRYDLMVGEEIVILGSGDIGLIMARRLSLEGAHVICVAEKEPVSGGLPRNIVQCLNDYDIPLLLNTTVTTVYGTKRVESVDLAETDDAGNEIPGTKRNVKCDTLILSVGLIPSDEIADEMRFAAAVSCTGEADAGRQVNARYAEDGAGDGANAGPADSGHATACGAEPQKQREVCSGLFFCGNVAYVHDLVDKVAGDGETAATEAAAYLRGQKAEFRFSAERLETVRAANGSAQAQKRLARLEKAKSGRRTVTCILCPNGCEIDEKLDGGKCPKGAEYVRAEILTPTRVLTTSVKVTHPKEAADAGRAADGRLVSVRTSGPIPKERIPEAMALIRTLSAAAPICIGDVVQKDFLEPGIDLLATTDCE